MYSWSDCVYCLLVCVPVMHILFLCSKIKAGKPCNSFPLSTMYDTSSLYSFRILLLLIEVYYSYLFLLLIFQPIVKSGLTVSFHLPSFPSLSKDYLLIERLLLYYTIFS